MRYCKIHRTTPTTFCTISVEAIIHHCIYVDVPTFHTFVDVTIRALNVKLFDCLAILASVLLPEKKQVFVNSSILFKTVAANNVYTCIH